MSNMDKELVEQMFQAFETKDTKTVLSFFSDDAVLFDPHYPVPEMKGKAAIEQGCKWAFGSIKKPSFTIRRLWIEGDTGAVEVDTHHVFEGGMELEFSQVFVIETRDGLITRLQSYLPYGAPGIGGLVTKATRLMWRLQGKIK